LKIWTTPQDIKQRLQKEWERGRFLRAQLNQEPLFPWRIPLKHPSGKTLSDSFEAAQKWLEALEAKSKLKTGTGYDLEWKTINHRQLGKNRIPVAALFARQTDALAFLKKTEEAALFQKLSSGILEKFPQLRPWLAKFPHKVLEQRGDWPKIVAVLSYMVKNPRPNIYIRQLDLAGVDTKFIERHKKIMAQLLELVLPQDCIDHGATGQSGFARRYGFKSKPIQIRFRLLDPSLYICGLSDLQLPVEQFATLNLPVQRVFITENIINGLAFPDVAGALVIFGLGYGLDRLSEIHWLRSKKIYYWGDIDTHGFAMLDQARSYFPQILSLLMDQDTLLQHKPLWGWETSQAARLLLPRLHEAELKLYTDLQNNRYREAVRLEQEKIPYPYVKSSLTELE